MLNLVKICIEPVFAFKPCGLSSFSSQNPEDRIATAISTYCERDNPKMSNWAPEFDASCSAFRALLAPGWPALDLDRCTERRIPAPSLTYSTFRTTI
jgi:hypothetical protein